MLCCLFCASLAKPSFKCLYNWKKKEVCYNDWLFGVGACIFGWPLLWFGSFCCRVAGILSTSIPVPPAFHFHSEIPLAAVTQKLRVIFFLQKYIYECYIDGLHNLEKYCRVAGIVLKMSHFSKWFIPLHAQRKLVFAIIYVTLLGGCSSLGSELAKYQENQILVCRNREAFSPLPPRGLELYKSRYSHVCLELFLELKQ